MIVIFALGNPGKKFQFTRHNIGFQIADKLIQDFNISPSQKDKNEIFQNQSLEEAKKEDVYKKILELFPDAELIDIDVKKDEN